MFCVDCGEYKGIDGFEICELCEDAKIKAHKRIKNFQKRAKIYRKRWTELRYRVLERWGSVCMCCGAKDNLHVDHIKPKSKYPHLTYAFNNLQVLCKDCNQGKGTWLEKDFRPSPSRQPSP